MSTATLVRNVSRATLELMTIQCGRIAHPRYTNTDGTPVRRLSVTLLPGESATVDRLSPALEAWVESGRVVVVSATREHIESASASELAAIAKTHQVTAPYPGEEPLRAALLNVLYGVPLPGVSHPGIVTKAPKASKETAREAIKRG